MSHNRVNSHGISAPTTQLLAVILGVCSTLYCPISISESGNVVEIIALRNRPAEEIQALLTPMLEDDEAISGNGFNLIIKSTEPRQASIRQLVEQLDTPLHNLLISVLQNSLKSADELNAEARLSASSSTIRMQGMTSDTRNLDRQRTLQQLKTLEGQAAHIEVGASRPVENVTIYDSGYGYPGIASSTQMQEAGTGFAVVPRLTGNQEVLLDINPWSDRFLSRAGLSTQSVQSTIRTRLGEWVELGGMGDTQQYDTQGFRGFNYTTRRHDMHILLKVELAD